MSLKNHKHPVGESLVNELIVWFWSYRLKQTDGNRLGRFWGNTRKMDPAIRSNKMLTTCADPEFACTRADRRILPVASRPGLPSNGVANASALPGSISNANLPFPQIEES